MGKSTKKEEEVTESKKDEEKEEAKWILVWINTTDIYHLISETFRITLWSQTNTPNDIGTFLNFKNNILKHITNA